MYHVIVIVDVRGRNTESDILLFAFVREPHKIEVIYLSVIPHYDTFYGIHYELRHVI